ncbi:MAG: response regulator transcription factor, partial [Candidatus Sericytochromatia bacterium]
MKILIIEDEKKLAQIISKGLKESDFITEISNDGEEGLYMASEFQYDAIILDLSLPKLDGLDVLKSLREKEIYTPVLVLTARSEITDKIKGLNLGADDYLTKPFDFDELLARLNSLIRRSKNNPSPIIKIEDLEVNMDSKTVFRDNKEIKLSTGEYNLLEYLVLNKGKVISRTELTEHLYSIDFDLNSNVL